MTTITASPPIRAIGSQSGGREDRRPAGGRPGGRQEAQRPRRSGPRKQIVARFHCPRLADRGGCRAVVRGAASSWSSHPAKGKPLRAAEAFGERLPIVFV